MGRREVDWDWIWEWEWEWGVDREVRGGGGGREGGRWRKVGNRGSRNEDGDGGWKNWLIGGLQGVVVVVVMEVKRMDDGRGERA